MGLTCRCRGLSTLIANLVSSRSQEIPAAFADNRRHWVQEYVEGAAKEIYSCALASRFYGLSFVEATTKVHHETRGQVTVIAMCDQNGQLEFQPGHQRIIGPQDRQVFVIAESASVLNTITTTNSPVKSLKYVQ